MQEALRNAVSHGRATHVTVDIALESRGLLVSVSDDGSGFHQAPITLPEPRPGGMGLLGMRERVELLGGVFELRSVVGTGTTIRARFPM